MKIFGVNIIYDEEETKQLRAQFKDSLSSEKLRRLRAYEVTDKYDKFRKYRCVFNPWDFLCLHVWKVFDYWLFKRRRNISNYNPIRRETSRPLPHKE
jgi:hypothetical protein